jgi:hypothetical protein
MRMLAYGTPGYAKDEYLCVGDSTAIESMHMFRMGSGSNFWATLFARAK